MGPRPNEGEAYDFVIVGAGAAGCVVANRLTEDPACRVLLIEAGPDYGPNAADWPAAMRDSSGIVTDSHSWDYLLSGRSPERLLQLPRARVVGGSSTINGCMWLRGSASDYDGWADHGNPGWGFADLLPYFRRAERDPLGGPLHVTDGPVPVSREAVDVTPVDGAFIAAAEALGFPRVVDFNGDTCQGPGVGSLPKNVAGGERMNGSFTYLTPAVRGRPNLAMVVETQVDRVVMQRERAVGVRAVDGRVFHCDEVVLCAGAYGSPAILMRSGIGPADHLDALDIEVAADLPGVGEHLMDHPLIEDFVECSVRPEFAPARVSFVPVLLKARSSVAGEEIDLHVYHGQYFDAERGCWIYFQDISLAFANSCGRIRLTSRDPEATLDIDHNHLSLDTELEACCDGVELANQLIATDPLAGMLDIIDGGPTRWGSRDELRALVREHIRTTFHPSSTCRMGPPTDRGAVVDHNGCVYGATGLRVIDASIFPTGPRANIHFTTIAVAEKLADVVRSSRPPSSA